MLGALLETLARTLALLADVTVPGLPRMADFARFGVAVERAAGWPHGAFLAAYGANRETVSDLDLEATLVSGPCGIRDEPGVDWDGVARETLTANRRAP